MARTKAKPKANDDNAAAVAQPSITKTKTKAKATAKRKADDTDDAAAAPPSKRPQRKSAAASLVKLKKIAATEKDLTDTGELRQDVSELDVHDLEVDEEVPVAPGFRMWKSNVKLLAKKGKTMTVTKVSTVPPGRR